MASPCASLHQKRHKCILAEFPQIVELTGNTVSDPSYPLVTLALAFSHVFFAVWFASHIQSLWLLCLVAYIVGGCYVTALIAAMHENVHYAFKYPSTLSESLGLVANFPIGYPIYGEDRYLHHNHHNFLGSSQDYNTIGLGEAQFFDSNRLKRLLWLLFKPFYPFSWKLFIGPFWNFTNKRRLEQINILLELLYVIAGTHFAGWKFATYTLISAYIGGGYGGIHFNKLRFLTKHNFKDPEKPTFSYYGWENKLLFNLLYHNEHHDFLTVPGRYTPQVRQMAREVYSKTEAPNLWEMLKNILTEKRKILTESFLSWDFREEN